MVAKVNKVLLTGQDGNRLTVQVKRVGFIEDMAEGSGG